MKQETVTVALRPIAMRMAAAHAGPAVDEADASANPGAARLLRLFRHHGARPDDRVRVKLQREAAEVFVRQIALEAADTTPSLLVEVVPGGLASLPANGRIDGPPRNLPPVLECPPASGQAALVELASDIRLALCGAGRPMRVDPLIALETHEAIKREHKRTRGRSAASIEKTAYRLRSSVDTVERVLPAGRGVNKAIQNALRNLPRGTKPLMVLADYDAKCLEVIVSKPD